MTTGGAKAWALGQLALRLLAVDPGGLGGMVLRARAGPVRDAFTEATAILPLPRQRLHPEMGDEALFGGMDLSATLAAGRPVMTPGLLAQPAALHLAMAERCGPELAARLGQVLDQAGGHCLIALDEGAEPDEHTPAKLSERLAFHADLELTPLRDAAPADLPDPAPAAARLAGIGVPDDAVIAVTTLAAQFGIDSLRAPRLALRAARAHAALFGRTALTPEDIAAAVGLVYPQRATRVPDEHQEEEEEDSADPPPSEPQDSTAPDDSDSPTDMLDLPPEMLIEAVRALLPDGLLQALASAQPARGGQGSGAGARRKGNRRGRPLPARPGRLDGRARIDLVATLRSAAPWQTIRKRLTGSARRLIVLPQDIHLRRYEDLSDRLLIFAVDASGSAALARLSEAKGAVELLLAQAYAQRDHVALIAFRGDGAQLLLPPTRSLVQTKRRLSALPGGGGTPLAAGLKAAADLAGTARSHGLTPTLALLTDGRANIALNGQADRAQAAADATRMGLWLRSAGVPSVVLDMGNRPSAPLAQLAQGMGGRYIALPRADARRLSTAVADALET